MDRETMTLDAPDFLLKVNFRKKIGRKLQKITGFFFLFPCIMKPYIYSIFDNF